MLIQQKAGDKERGRSVEVIALKRELTVALTETHEAARKAKVHLSHSGSGSVPCSSDSGE